MARQQNTCDNSPALPMYGFTTQPTDKQLEELMPEIGPELRVKMRALYAQRARGMMLGQPLYYFRMVDDSAAPQWDTRAVLICRKVERPADGTITILLLADGPTLGRAYFNRAPGKVTIEPLNKEHYASATIPAKSVHGMYAVLAAAYPENPYEWYGYETGALRAQWRKPAEVARARKMEANRYAQWLAGEDARLRRIVCNVQKG